MTNIKRYAFQTQHQDPSIFEGPDGDYVRWEDYKEAQVCMKQIAVWILALDKEVKTNGYSELVPYMIEDILAMTRIKKATIDKGESGGI